MKTTSLVSLRRAAPALAAACALLSGAVTQAQPSLASISPDGSVQFQYTNKLTFTISSVAGVAPANISVQLWMTNLSNVGSTTNLYSTNGLTVGGTATSRVVTTPLTSNLTYSAIITATDINGTSETTNLFDTVLPSYTWEAEDYDYGGGLFFDNPQTNAYAGLVASNHVDAYNDGNGGGTAYRPINTGADTGGDLGNEVNGDRARIQYVAASLSDYDVGWNNAGSGEWANYTRHYPTGKWNIYARVATWAASTGSSPLATMLQGGGPSGTYLGEFVAPNTETAASTYQNYTWAPLTDVAGNLVEWDTDGSKQILTTMVGAGSYNFNCFMLIPINPSYKPVPFVSGVSPNGSTQMFPYTNLLAFTANSVPGMTTNDVVVTLNGIAPYGLTYSGSSHALTGTIPIATNVIYSVAITLTDANGSSTYTTSFGTYYPSNYTFECEDYDYTNGLFFDNPQVDAYAGLDGVPGVDGNDTSSGGGAAYRPDDSANQGNEVNGDIKRAQYVALGTNDYDIGWTAAGQWANYTRTYPAGVYNVMFRAAGNAGGTDMASLLRVTSGVGTSSQTTTRLGQFNVPNTGSWQIYTWAPLVDASGNLVTITNSGKVSTLQLHEDAGGWNGNFLMFTPVDTVRPTVTQLYPDGKAMFQPTNTLSFVATSALAIDTNLLSVTINGVAVNNLVFSGPPTNLTVSWPNLQPSAAYGAVIAVKTTNNDPFVVSYFFDTFQSANYTFEAEDWDYSGGKFFDNPQVDAYIGLTGTPGVDAINLNTGGGTAYRPEDAGDPGNEQTGDVTRAQYVTAGALDYDLGWTGAGQWCNYTRTYPTGVFNFWLRGAAPGVVTNGATLSRVTSGLGTSNQNTTALGQFNFPATGGYQTWTWTPLVDSGANMVAITNSGAVSTFRLSQNSGGWNANCFMLVPATSFVSKPPSLTFSRTAGGITITWAPTGGRLEASPVLGASANWQPIGATNPAVIPITGAAQYFRVINP